MLKNANMKQLFSRHADKTMRERDAMGKLMMPLGMEPYAGLPAHPERKPLIVPPGPGRAMFMAMLDGPMVICPTTGPLKPIPEGRPTGSVSRYVELSPPPVPAVVQAVAEAAVAKPHRPVRQPKSAMGRNVFNSIARLMEGTIEDASAVTDAIDRLSEQMQERALHALAMLNGSARSDHGILSATKSAIMSALERSDGLSALLWACGAAAVGDYDVTDNLVDMMLAEEGIRGQYPHQVGTFELWPLLLWRMAKRDLWGCSTFAYVLGAVGDGKVLHPRFSSGREEYDPQPAHFAALSVHANERAEQTMVCWGSPANPNAAQKKSKVEIAERRLTKALSQLPTPSDETGAVQSVVVYLSGNEHHASEPSEALPKQCAPIAECLRKKVPPAARLQIGFLDSATGDPIGDLYAVA